MNQLEKCIVDKDVEILKYQREIQQLQEIIVKERNRVVQLAMSSGSVNQIASSITSQSNSNSNVNNTNAGDVENVNPSSKFMSPRNIFSPTNNNSASIPLSLDERYRLFINNHSQYILRWIMTSAITAGKLSNPFCASESMESILPNVNHHRLQDCLVNTKSIYGISELSDGLILLRFAVALIITSQASQSTSHAHNDFPAEDTQTNNNNNNNNNNNDEIDESKRRKRRDKRILSKVADDTKTNLFQLDPKQFTSSSVLVNPLSLDQIQMLESLSKTSTNRSNEIVSFLFTLCRENLKFKMFEDMNNRTSQVEDFMKGIRKIMETVIASFIHFTIQSCNNVFDIRNGNLFMGCVNTLQDQTEKLSNIALCAQMAKKKMITVSKFCYNDTQRGKDELLHGKGNIINAKDLSNAFALSPRGVTPWSPAMGSIQSPRFKSTMHFATTNTNMNTNLNDMKPSTFFSTDEILLSPNTSVLSKHINFTDQLTANTDSGRNSKDTLNTYDIAAYKELAKAIDVGYADNPTIHADITDIIKTIEEIINFHRN